MSPSETPVPIDQDAEARQLADLFANLSQALNNFRRSDPHLTSAQSDHLKKKAGALQDLSIHFTAEAIGATLQEIQPNLEHIKTLTTEAENQVAQLKDISKVLSIAASVFSLGMALAPQPASVVAAIDTLEQTLKS